MNRIPSTTLPAAYGITRAEALRPVLTELAGMSANAIAAELNARNVATPSGGRWHALTVIRVQRRLQEALS